MPVYAFDCERCGPFDLERRFEDAGGPARCPTCAGPARRIFTPPGLVRTPKPVRRARDLEERSTHEPDVVREPTGRPLRAGRHGHHQPPWVVGH